MFNELSLRDFYNILCDFIVNLTMPSFITDSDIEDDDDTDMDTDDENFILDGNSIIIDSSGVENDDSYKP